jgi:phenazine biosynthesis protein phzE
MPRRPEPETEPEPPVLAGLVAQRHPPPFALLHRPHSGADGLDLLLGTVSTYPALADIPLPPAGGAGGPRQDVLALVPYRQIAERGFAHTDDGVPLLAMSVDHQERVPLHTALRLLPDEPPVVTGGRFDVSDEDYAETVKKVVTDEIGWGEGANFVIRRSYVADLAGDRARAALSIFRRLLRGESGAYWTYVVHTAERTFVGASPERHVSLARGTAVMNPISGTLRHPPSGATLAEVEHFLADRKETDELNMVLDEELKMMARFCAGGGRVVGPYLKEMARLAHTEYLIEGRTEQDPRTILRETMFAPTVTGSPLENACRVITRYEQGGRGYYSGIAALVGRDERGGRTLDSAIMIRTADIDPGGRLRIGVGATLVRHSHPVSEVAETAAKAAGMLQALGVAHTADGDSAPAPAQQKHRMPRPGAQPPAPAARFGSHPRVRAALARRNEGLAGFWLAPQQERARPVPQLDGRRALIVDAEDTFTAMIAVQLRAIGLGIEVRRFDEPFRAQDWDLVVAGPGPGDPREDGDPKIARLRTLLGTLLAGSRPFLAVCLSHQVLCTELGLPLRRRTVPNQGTQKAIDLFGRAERVGFYNTFAATCASPQIRPPRLGGAPVRVSADPVTSEVHALRGPGFASFQFHAESVLTLDGLRLLTAATTHTLGAAGQQLDR